MNARQVAVALGCVCGALAVYSVSSLMHTNRLRTELAEATRRADALVEQNTKLKAATAAATGHDTTEPNVPARQERPERDTPKADKRDIASLTTQLHAIAEAIKAGPGAGDMNKNDLPPKSRMYVSESVTKIAEGMQLWQDYSRGGINDNDFNRERLKTRDVARGKIGFFFAELWRERHVPGGRPAPAEQVRDVPEVF